MAAASQSAAVSAMAVGAPLGLAIPVNVCIQLDFLLSSEVARPDRLGRLEAGSKECLCMVQCPSFAKKTYGGSTVPPTSVVCSTSWSTLATTSNAWFIDQVGSSICTGLLWITQRWPSNASGWFVKNCTLGAAIPWAKLLCRSGCLLAARESARVLKFDVSLLCLGGVARSRRCPQRHGATTQCCIIGRILVTPSNRGRSSAAACAATRPTPPGTRIPCWAWHSRTLAWAYEKIAQAPSPDPCASAMGGRGFVGESLRAHASVDGAPFFLKACWPTGPPCGLGKSVGGREKKSRGK